MSNVRTRRSALCRTADFAFVLAAALALTAFGLFVAYADAPGLQLAAQPGPARK